MFHLFTSKSLTVFGVCLVFATEQVVYNGFVSLVLFLCKQLPAVAENNPEAGRVNQNGKVTASLINNKLKTTAKLHRAEGSYTSGSASRAKPLH